jgi:hypothetical protein
MFSSFPPGSALIGHFPLRREVHGKGYRRAAASPPSSRAWTSTDHDYRVNLKAEFEIRSLHEKIDHMLVHQWQRLMEIQQVQTDLLSELRSRKSGS